MMRPIKFRPACPCLSKGPQQASTHTSNDAASCVISTCGGAWQGNPRPLPEIEGGNGPLMQTNTCGAPATCTVQASTHNRLQKGLSSTNWCQKDKKLHIFLQAWACKCDHGKVAH